MNNFIRFKKIFFQFLLSSIIFHFTTSQAENPRILQVKEAEIIVNGKKARVFDIIGQDGVPGLILNKGEPFNVTLENRLQEPTSVHWHGLIDPSTQDGVPYVSQLPINAGEKYSYNFTLSQSGTYWMHSHLGLQEQQLLSAPLIILDPADSYLQELEVIMFLEDFSFKNPSIIFDQLKRTGGMMGGGMMNADSSGIDYDAFLINRKAPSNPETIPVTPGKTVRLRIINGSSATNFIIDLGTLKGEAIAVDGSDILPIFGSQFEIAVAQRLDLRIKIPEGTQAFPILAIGEGVRLQTGLILATTGAPIPTIPEYAKKKGRQLSYHQEKIFKAKNPLPEKRIDRRLIANLSGGMPRYVWTINNLAWPNHRPLIVKEGERVELTFINNTMMSHPMHLHGHIFQVTEINGQSLRGALRDTVLVLPGSIVKVQFDANNVGNWALHCHILYHMEAGMMTTMIYEEYKGPFFEIKSH